MHHIAGPSDTPEGTGGGVSIKERGKEAWLESRSSAVIKGRFGFQKSGEENSVQEEDLKAAGSGTQSQGAAGILGVWEFRAKEAAAAA